MVRTQWSELMSRKFAFGGSYSGFVFDADALAYFDANTSITLDADKLAIDAFYKGLKADGIYTSLKAMYLPKWNGATNDKWNLINPIDSNTAFRLVFNGGITHSTSGFTPNGVNGYANTFFDISSNFNSNTDASMGVYLRTNTVSDNADMGAGSTIDSTKGMLIYSRFASTFYGCAMGNTLINSGVSNTDSRGFFAVSRISGVQSQYKRGTSTINSSETEASITPLSGNIWIGGAYTTTGSAIQKYSNRQIPFAYIGDGLTQSEIDLLYSRVQTLMTYFGINV